MQGTNAVAVAFAVSIALAMFTTMVNTAGDTTTMGSSSNECAEDKHPEKPTLA